MEASNWCRGNGEAGVAGVARIARLKSKRLGYRQAEGSRLLFQMASAEMSGASTSSVAPAATEIPQKQAADMVQEFYGAINRREIASVGDLFADDCVYEDLVFPKPFVGRKAILEFFQKFVDSVGSELEFRVDDITTGDPNAAGVTWHLEWNGKPFPFSKGCSFYRCQVFNGNRQFVYGRDAVEPATKPGDLTLVALKGLGALLRRFPSLADRF